MTFEMTNEDLMMRELFRKFTLNEVEPIAAEIDDLERFPEETVKKMANLGMMGIPFPREYGGAGGTYWQYINLVEELAVACGTTSVVLSAHTSLCAAPIYEFGTEEQKQKYLVPLQKAKN